MRFRLDIVGQFLLGITGYDAEGTGNENVTAIGYQAGYRSRANGVSIEIMRSNRYYTAGGALQNT